jgi:tellurite resistance protein TehA-like permease
MGPLGMGSFGIMRLGAVAMQTFPKTHTIHEMAGPMAYFQGVFIALILWGFTLFWFFQAVASVHHSRPFPFNMGWWGFTFPIGTFALSSNTLAKDIPSRFFRVIGAMASVVVFLLWLLVMAGTIRDLITGGDRLYNKPTPIQQNMVGGKVNGMEGEPADGVPKDGEHGAENDKNV